MPFDIDYLKRSSWLPEELVKGILLNSVTNTVKVVF